MLPGSALKQLFFFFFLTQSFLSRLTRVRGLEAGCSLHPPIASFMSLPPTPMYSHTPAIPWRFAEQLSWHQRAWTLFMSVWLRVICRSAIKPCVMLRSNWRNCFIHQSLFSLLLKKTRQRQQWVVWNKHFTEGCCNCRVWSELWAGTAVMFLNSRHCGNQTPARGRQDLILPPPPGSGKRVHRVSPLIKYNPTSNGLPTCIRAPMEG